MYQILESQQPNNLFRSPIGDKAQNILDIGTGNGAWCRDVADKFPHGMSLYPISLLHRTGGGMGRIEC